MGLRCRRERNCRCRVPWLQLILHRDEETKWDEAAPVSSPPTLGNGLTEEQRTHDLSSRRDRVTTVKTAWSKNSEPSSTRVHFELNGPGWSHDSRSCLCLLFCDVRLTKPPTRDRDVFRTPCPLPFESEKKHNESGKISHKSKEVARPNGKIFLLWVHSPTSHYYIHVTDQKYTHCIRG